MTPGVTARSSARDRVRTGAAFALCLAMLFVGLALALIQGAPRVPPLHQSLPPTLLGTLLLASYFYANWLTLDFEIRGNAHSVTLGQLPLAFGVLFAPPWLHLLACAGAATVTAVARRQHVLKALYNIGAATFEVGAGTFIVSLASTGGRPTPSMWLALLLAMLVTDGVGSLVLTGVWWLIRVPVGVGKLFQPLAFGAIMSSVSTGITVLAVSAAYTEPSSVVTVVALAVGLSHFYRRYQQLRARQTATQQLYTFVRELGPLDPEGNGAARALEQVRLLLNAERTELLLAQPDQVWQRLVLDERNPACREVADPPAAATMHPQEETMASTEVIATTLFGSSGMLGVLTARHRLGHVRDFDLGDVRLLETVGSELATAIERGRLLADLRRTATTDALTGLPNLAELTRLLDQALQNSGEHIVVAAVSVDSFREVNETLGNSVGDELLLEAARRLQVEYPEALVGRLGGARFALARVWGARAENNDAVFFGLGLRSRVEGPARLAAVGAHIRLSVGVAQSPTDGRDADTLLRRAQTAMSSAQSAQGGPVAWAPVYEIQGQRRLAVVTALREAIAGGSIALVYQPKVDALTGQACGVEALARWTHPALGNVSPEEFIPLAEASGLITPLTSFVLRQAAFAAKQWQRLAPGVGVSVNVSAHTLLDPSFLADVTDALSTTGLPAQLLTLELTEGVVVPDPELAATRLGELRSRGVRISVDDFGSGYSSLTYLKGLPVDEVKIDKSFVSGLGRDSADAAVVRAVVDIGHTLGLRVVAEGVETGGQQQSVVDLGVDEAQGWLHARPMPAAAMAAWLGDRRERVRH